MNKETRALEDGAEDSRQMYFLLYEKKLIVKIIKKIRDRIDLPMGRCFICLVYLIETTF